MPFSGTDDERKRKRNAWYARNREKQQKYGKDWRSSNRQSYNEKSAQYKRERIRKMKADLVALMGGKCQNPGCISGASHPCMFDFHHPYRNGKEQRIQPNGEQRYGQPTYFRTILREWKADPKSVQLVCANCHRLIHFTEH